MENLKAKELFESQFKYRLHQEVRHKADNKGYNADLGLLIIGRFLSETVDDDGNYNYSRLYECRMIRFSGSGERQHFKESELITIEEFNKKTVEDEQQRQDMRNQMHQVQDEIYSSFDVKQNTEIYLVINGEVDKSKIYKITGYKTDENGTFILARIAYGEGIKRENIEIFSKEQFIKK